jgi:dUTP pyrophosphatase
MKVKVKLLHPDAVLPVYATSGSSGFDLVSIEDVLLYPGDTRAIKTGLAMDVGAGYELQVRPRSGLSLNSNLRVANAPGTVDADYRGEICVIMTNTTSPSQMVPSGPGNSFRAIMIHKGDRIAQGVVQAVEQAKFQVVEELDSTKRGFMGFGSTGK